MLEYCQTTEFFFYNEDKMNVLLLHFDFWEGDKYKHSQNFPIWPLIQTELNNTQFRSLFVKQSAKFHLCNIAQIIQHLEDANRN